MERVELGLREDKNFVYCIKWRVLLRYFIGQIVIKTQKKYKNLCLDLIFLLKTMYS